MIIPEGMDHVMSKHLAPTMNPRRCSPELFKELLGKVRDKEEWQRLMDSGAVVELVGAS
jgi:hypothetical protein